jgi:hypothetical protein
MYRNEKLEIASQDFVKSLTKARAMEDSQPADRVSLGFDAVLAQLQELVSTLSDRVTRGEAVIDRIEEALSNIGIDLDEAEEEAENTEDSENDSGEETGGEGGEGGEESAPEEGEEPAPEEGEEEPENNNFD